jgi:hypothetical protein
MANTPRTNPSRATREEERRDAQVQAGPDAVDESMVETDAEPDPEVAEHYEEMTERGARQRGEGRLP